MDRFPSLKELGVLVRDKRKRERLSQKALADLVGVSHVTVLAIEKGTGAARLENAWKILAGLGLAEGPVTHPADRDRIDVNERHELRDWSKRFGVTEDRLKSAVEAAGPMAKDVAKKLGKIL